MVSSAMLIKVSHPFPQAEGVCAHGRRLNMSLWLISAQETDHQVVANVGHPARHVHVLAMHIVYCMTAENLAAHGVVRVDTKERMPRK